MSGDQSKLTSHINRKSWWHVPPSDPIAYTKRGKFLAPSFSEAEFYGRPSDEPERVTVANLLVGDEAHIELTLLGCHVSEKINALEGLAAIEERLALDAKLKDAALLQGYDCIVLFTPQAFQAFRESGRIPRSIELNILTPKGPAK